MVRLRVDTWDAEYGSSYEAMEPIDSRPPPIREVEDCPWAPVQPDSPEWPARIGFIDGVRRVDVRLFAEDTTSTAPALAGSWAVGVAWADRPPTFGTVRLGRQLVVGGGLDHEDLEIVIGRHRLVYVFSAVTGNTSIDPIQGLQNAMRQAEADLARSELGEGDGRLMMLDGPLTYFAPNAPVVGMIKRQMRSYLSPKQAGVLAELGLGERTPLFSIGDQRLERFSWYARIGVRRPIDGVMTGIVRLEASTELGVAAASRLADTTTAILPRFATEIGRDPRAPQNLYPVAQLERELHHRLGDGALIKRAFEEMLWRGNA